MSFSFLVFQISLGLVELSIVGYLNKLLSYSILVSVTCDLCILVSKIDSFILPSKKHVFFWAFVSQTKLNMVFSSQFRMTCFLSFISVVILD